MEKIRTREFGFFFFPPFELQLLLGICGLRAMFLGQPLLMTCTGVLTSQQPQRSSPFPAWKSDTHLHLHPPAHLSFKRHEPCRLFWTLCRLNSFKISFNYRPSTTGETFFELAIIAFVGGSILRTETFEQYLPLGAIERCIRIFFWQQPAITKGWLSNWWVGILIMWFGQELGLCVL